MPWLGGCCLIDNGGDSDTPEDSAPDSAVKGRSSWKFLFEWVFVGVRIRSRHEHHRL